MAEIRDADYKSRANNANNQREKEAAPGFATCLLWETTPDAEPTGRPTDRPTDRHREL